MLSPRILALLFGTGVASHRCSAHSPRRTRALLKHPALGNEFVTFQMASKMRRAHAIAYAILSAIRRRRKHAMQSSRYPSFSLAQLHRASSSTTRIVVDRFHLGDDQQKIGMGYRPAAFRERTHMPAGQRWRVLFVTSMASASREQCEPFRCRSSPGSERARDDVHLSTPN